MRNFHIYTLAAVVSVLLFSSCGSDLSPEHSDGQMVMIKAPVSCEFQTFGSTSRTKSGTGSDGFDELFINTSSSIGLGRNMEKGSTLWLLVEVPGDGYTLSEDIQTPSDVQKPESWQESEYSYKPYVVGDNGAMFPCEVEDSVGVKDGKPASFLKLKRDSNGNPIRSGSALMLPAGLYRFHAVSPATAILKELDGTPQTLSVHLSNGKYTLATDTRWRESYPKGILIRGGTQTSGVQSISLPSLVNQTARIKVNIRCGENVHILSVQKSGIEISGIQEDSHADFKWTMDGEPIGTIIGNKYESTMLFDYEYGSDDNGDVITGYASILPTDARTNTIYILFHLMVNNVPTQYMVGLSHQLYEAAHQYEFNFKVKIDGNITVGTWDNDSSVYDNVELN